MLRRASLLSTGLTALALVALAQRTAAQESGEKGHAKHDPRWAVVHEIFGQGEAEGRYFRVNLPRSDLHVRIANDTLSPAFEFTSYVGFAPAGASDVLAMGEVILLPSELTTVLDEARRQGVRVTAVHNHLVGEEPRIVYVHVMAEGAPRTVATALRAVFARSATPLAPPAEEPSHGDWSAIDTLVWSESNTPNSIAVAAASLSPE